MQEGEYGFADIAVFCRVTALTRPFRTGLPVRPRSPIRSSAAWRSTSGRRSRTSLAYLNLMVNPKDDLAFARVVNVPPRGLGKTSIEHLIAAARERRFPCWRWRGRRRKITALRDKAGRALEDFARLIDELATLRDGSAEQGILKLLTRTGYREYLSSENRETRAKIVWRISTN